MYIALKYVDTGKRLYRPGEMIEEDPNAEWHLKIGAIRKASAREGAEAILERGRRERPAEAKPQQEAPVDVQEESRAEPEEPEETEEAWDEPAPPVVDALDGIVTGEEEPKKPATRRKTASTSKAKSAGKKR